MGFSGHADSASLIKRLDFGRGVFLFPDIVNRVAKLILAGRLSSRNPLKAENPVGKYQAIRSRISCATRAVNRWFREAS